MRAESIRPTLAGLLALTGCVAVGGQFGILLADRPLTPQGVLSAAGTFLQYFTLLTNSLVTATLVAHALPTHRRLAWLSALSWTTAMAVYLTIVAVIYHVMLRMLWNPQGFQKVVDVLLHYVQPPAFVFWWALFVPKTRLRLTQVLGWLAFPLAYGVAIVLAGAITGTYAYPFVDVSELGLLLVVRNMLGMATAFIVVGAAYRAIANWQSRRVAS